MSAIDRRSFLLAGAGLALTAACGAKKDDGGVVAKVSDPSKPGSTKAAAFNPVVASYLHVAGIDERFTIALLNGEGTGPVALNGPVKLTINGEPVASEVHQDGIPLPYLLVRHRFAEPGVVQVGVTFDGDTAETALQVVDGQGLKVPYPGTAMIVTPSPTATATLGVDPICTADPICPLHDVSLDALLAAKRPTAVLFSTPARCQSRLCGPVLDNLLAERAAFADRIGFHHVEIYKARTGDALSPTVDAYGLQQEPVLFLAGPDGIVEERLDNAIDKAELKAALERLAG